MSYEIQLVDLQEQPAAVVRGLTDQDGITDFLGEAFGEVMRVLEGQDATYAGAPFGRYRVASDGGWEVEAGFPVDRPIVAEGRVEPRTLPGGRAAKTVHKGAYDQVGGAYEATLAWVIDNGYKPSAEPWEAYLDPPEVREPRTEVFIPCEHAARSSA